MAERSAWWKGSAAFDFAVEERGTSPDICSQCGATGELLCCDGGCNGAWHLRCLFLDSVPAGDEWFCDQCSLKRLRKRRGPGRAGTGQGASFSVRGPCTQLAAHNRCAYTYLRLLSGGGSGDGRSDRTVAAPMKATTVKVTTANSARAATRCMDAAYSGTVDTGSSGLGPRRWGHGQRGAPSVARELDVAAGTSAFRDAAKAQLLSMLAVRRRGHPAGIATTHAANTRASLE